VGKVKSENSKSLEQKENRVSDVDSNIKGKPNSKALQLNLGVLGKNPSTVSCGGRERVAKLTMGVNAGRRNHCINGGGRRT